MIKNIPNNATLLKKINSKKQSLVLVDYDDTSALSPEAFSRVIAVFESVGYVVLICTSRAHDDDNSDLEKDFPDTGVVYCNGEQKEQILTRLGIKKTSIAFWIDDCPLSIPEMSDMEEVIEYSGDW